MIRRPRQLAMAILLLALLGLPAIAAPSITAPPARTFANACASCHEGNGFGVQVLAARLGAERTSLRRTPALPPAYIRHVVRNGLGAMPAMSRIEVTDAELDAIIAELAGDGAA